jgi:hypothetical protein
LVIFFVWQTAARRPGVSKHETRHAKAKARPPTRSQQARNPPCKGQSHIPLKILS